MQLSTQQKDEIVNMLAADLLSLKVLPTFSIALLDKMLHSMNEEQVGYLGDMILKLADRVDSIAFPVAIDVAVMPDGETNVDG